MKRTLRLVTLVPVVALGVAPPARGQALVDFTGGSLFASFQGDGDTIGWGFSTNERFVVTHLGFWDGDEATQAMTLSHPVGLWTSGGDLLASNTVAATSPLTAGWRYEPVTPTILPVGAYHLGAFVAAGNPPVDGYVSGTTSQTMATGFTLGLALRDPDGAQTGLVFPSVTSTAGGRFGPNLLFAAPAPDVDLLMTVGTDGRSYGCGASTAIALPAGADVFPCYTIANVGNAPLTRHDLVDSRSGPILADFPYTLLPGASAFLTQDTNSPAGGAWTSSWTAYNPGPFEQVSDGGSLGITVLPPVLTCNGPTVTFSSGFPAGITSFDGLAWPSAGDSTTDLWTLASCGEAQNWTGARGNLACASSDFAGAGPYDTQLRTHAFGLAGQSSARIEFTMNYQQMADSLAIDSSVDNGMSWQNLAVAVGNFGPFRAVGGVRASVSLGPLLGQPAVRLRWRYSNAAAGASDLYLQIDNVALTCGDGIFFDGFESGDDHAWSVASS
jgi:hypothetical protein